MRIKIETTVHLHQERMLEYLTFTPVLKVNVAGRGEIRFASYDCWIDEPEKINDVRAEAVKNARESLRYILKQLTVANQ